MSVSNYYANAILDRTFGNTTWNTPATLYLGLSTGIITASSTGTTVSATEPSGNGYARVSISNSDKTNWNVASNGSLTNKVTFTFPEASASWGTITYVFIADALTNGNIIAFEALATPRVVQSNTTVIFASSPAAITISMTNS